MGPVTVPNDIAFTPDIKRPVAAVSGVWGGENPLRTGGVDLLGGEFMASCSVGESL